MERREGGGTRVVVACPLRQTGASAMSEGA
jgi:hypothetical protein